MNDSYGDGWNRNVFGIEQNNVIVSTFGENFTNGYSLGPVILNVIPNISATLTLVTLGAWTE